MLAYIGKQKLDRLKYKLDRFVKHMIDKNKNLIYFWEIFLLIRLMFPYVGKQKLGC